ncbi:MAG: TonB-dependent receptor, partial [Gemmatimonadota bacterium]|nr:TonB-dependent receptor [Gemmatimonadota bacterium]
DSSRTKLPPVVVEVGRDGGRPLLELPYSISSVTPDSARPGQRHSSLDETLFLIPGVSVFNRNNPAQDARISIRGFGARSSFGVRGIRVMRDGIPLTLADGQTPIDYLDLENVGRVEVLRGSASSLYGSAGGGVIDIRSSEPGPASLSATAKAWSADHSSRKTVAQTAGRLSRFAYQTTASRWRTDGFRAHSKQETTTGDLRGELAAGATKLAASFEGYEMPLAESPGALTLAQMNADPEMADPLSVRRAAGKTVKQAQFGATAVRALGKGELRASVHSGRRALYNPLTFAIVHVQRHTSGAELRGTLPALFQGREHRLTGGIELQRQNDARRNYTNCTDLTTPITKATATCPAVGLAQGSTTLDQIELVTSSGLYVGDEVTISPRYIVMASARADAVKFAVKDRFITSTNPDDSGNRTLRSLSPMVGLTMRLSPTSSYYWNVSSAFETPTATELGNHSDGSAGINQDLRPQRSLTYEAGYKGVASSGLQYSAAVFSTGVRDELVPFEIPSSNGRRYFRNAGRTARKGLELSLGKTVGLADLGVAYTYGDYRYRSFTVAGTSFAGKRIPGAPAKQLQASATFRVAGTALVAEGAFSSRVFADDANTASAPGYGVINLRMVTAAVGQISGLSFNAGLYNALNRTYASSVAVNATGGKYFEPGQTRSVYAGFSFG